MTNLALIDRALPPAAATALILALTAPAALAAEGTYRVRSLVSDGGGQAEHIDKSLVNSWGIAFGAAGPAWIADNGTGKSTLYNGEGEAAPLVVAIPKGAPTGIVANGTSGFMVKAGKRRGPALFLFASEAGVISGWSPTVDAKNALPAFTAEDGAIYKGIALVGSHRLYATDFHNGKVDVLDDGFRPVEVPGGFKDPGLPKGFAPFGIRNVQGRLIVTFAKQDKEREDDVQGAGLGFVDAFDAQGRLRARLVSGGRLNAPWGIALAPKGFGPLAGDLLIGNFGDGRINAFDPATGHLRGTLSRAGKPVVIEDLWGLAFGNDVATQPAATLFFTAGPGDEQHGRYGRIDVTPGG